MQESIKMKRKTNQKTEKEIIQLYQSGLSMVKVGEKYNISSATVLRVLNEYKIEKRTKGGIYKISDKEVIDRYLNGESCQKIADSFNVTFHTISLILEKNNIERNNKYSNINLDNNYFENIDRSDKAYFLGFMLTDGNVALQENIIRLSLASKDEEILEIFKKRTHNDNKLCVREDQKHSERIFQLRSDKWKNDLAKYGVVPRKTFISQIPILSDNVMPHLIRGMIDGDGWISYKGRQLGFCGNENTVTQLRDYLVSKLSIRCNKIIHPEENLWSVTWGSLKDIKKIGDYIYQDKEDCFLTRKYNNFLQLIQGNTEVNS